MFYEKYFPVLEKRQRRGRIKQQRLQHYAEQLKMWDEMHHRHWTENVVQALKSERRLMSKKWRSVEECDQ